MQPVPREVSSSCGTSVIYESDQTREELLDTDYEALYEIKPEGYRLIRKNE